MKKIGIVAIIAAFVFASYNATIYFEALGEYQEKIDNIEIGEIDLSNVADGDYTGEYNANLVYCKVIVSVKDNQIINIEIVEHHNNRGKNAEVIIDDVVSFQSLDVDTISSATNSSKVILKAIENALDKEI